MTAKKARKISLHSDTNDLYAGFVSLASDLSLISQVYGLAQTIKICLTNTSKQYVSNIIVTRKGYVCCI